MFSYKFYPSPEIFTHFASLPPPPKVNRRLPLKKILFLLLNTFLSPWDGAIRLSLAPIQYT